MRRTGQLEAQGGDGVGEFVDQDGGVEGDREEEGDEVADGAEFGQDAVELAAEHPGDEGGDEEPAGRDVDGHAEGAAHQEAAAGLPGRRGGCPLPGRVPDVGEGAGAAGRGRRGCGRGRAWGARRRRGVGGAAPSAGPAGGFWAGLGGRPCLSGLARVVAGAAGRVGRRLPGVGVRGPGSAGPWAAVGVVGGVAVPRRSGAGVRRGRGRGLGPRWRSVASSLPERGCPLPPLSSTCPLVRCVSRSRSCGAGGSLVDGMRPSPRVPPRHPLVFRPSPAAAADGSSAWGHGHPSAVGRRVCRHGDEHRGRRARPARRRRRPAAAPSIAGPRATGEPGRPAVGRAAPPASLSPSRASDFMQCPLLYRFRVIDKLPEKPSEAATRGTLVHAVLERLFDAPAARADGAAAPSR